MTARQPFHEPELPSSTRRSRGSRRRRPVRALAAEELLEWALDRFHPRMAISAAGGVDGLALLDMAWRINPEVRMFTLDTGRLPAETYALFEEVRERYGIAVEFEFPTAPP